MFCPLSQFLMSHACSSSRLYPIAKRQSKGLASAIRLFPVDISRYLTSLLDLLLFYFLLSIDIFDTFNFLSL